MIDVSYFQNSTNNVQVFKSAGTWQTWIKPRNAKMVSFFVIGAGGGGGGGFQSGSGTICGGAGGGTAGNTKLLIQASLIPDILYIQTGTGGVGGKGGSNPTSGSAATKSYVCLSPDTASISNIVCTSGAILAQGGASGSVNTTSVAGAGETIAVASTSALFLNLGNFVGLAGSIGAGGGSGAGSGNSVLSFIINGGGGGGTSTSGNSSAGGPFPAVASTPINTNGANGLIFYKPIFGLTGGRGGGGGTTGGNGGNALFGAGGGGGGAGTTSAGNGGKGGDGLIIITTTF